MFVTVLFCFFFSAIHQLQQATAVQQQPHRNEQPPPSNENHQTIENGLASNDSSGRRINRKRKSIREPEHEPVSEPKTKQNRRHSMYSKANSQGQGRNRIFFIFFFFFYF